MVMYVSRDYSYEYVGAYIQPALVGLLRAGGANKAGQRTSFPQPHQSTDEVLGSKRATQRARLEYAGSQAEAWASFWKKNHGNHATTCGILWRANEA